VISGGPARPVSTVTGMTQARPTLVDVTMPERPEAIVLVLHGGRESSLAAVRSTQLAVLRMIPIANRIAKAGAGRLAVARLRYAVRGWNAPGLAPVRDTEWALDQLTARFPGCPIALVGHSMGGRTALRAAGYPGVQSVVGLAPWLPAVEPIDQLAGRRVLLIHGDQDRMTSSRATAAMSERLRSAGIAASFIEIRGERHGMLRQPRLWHDLTAGFLATTLLTRTDTPHGETTDPSAPNYLRQVVQGQARITIE